MEMHAQPVWKQRLKRKTFPSNIIAEYDTIWYVLSLWPSGVIWSVSDSSQSLVHPQPPHWSGKVGQIKPWLLNNSQKICVYQCCFAHRCKGLLWGKLFPSQLDPAVPTKGQWRTTNLKLLPDTYIHGFIYTPLKTCSGKYFSSQDCSRFSEEKFIGFLY